MNTSVTDDVRIDAPMVLSPTATKALVDALEATRAKARLQATCLAAEQLAKSVVDRDKHQAIVAVEQLDRLVAFARRNLRDLEGDAL